MQDPATAVGATAGTVATYSETKKTNYRRTDHDLNHPQTDPLQILRGLPLRHVVRDLQGTRIQPMIPLPYVDHADCAAPTWQHDL